MMVAVMNGNDEIVQLLLERNDIDVNATTGLGMTALMLAIRDEHLKIAQYLLQNPSIDVNVHDVFGTAVADLVYYWFIHEKWKQSYKQKRKVVKLLRERGASLDIDLRLRSLVI